MVPIVAIPVVIREFCSWFKEVFSRPEQRNHFEAWVTALAVTQNRTIAGVHQALVNGPTYEELHHFMTNSPWSVEALKHLRLNYIKNHVQNVLNGQTGKQRMLLERPLALIGTNGPHQSVAMPPTDQLQNSATSQTRDERVLLPQFVSMASSSVYAGEGEKIPPFIVSIDATFIHHVGEKIYGVYWYRDYAKRCYTLAQRLVLSTLVTPEKLVPLGSRLYHRGFLDEQKLYLEEQGPEPDADESTWLEYDKLIEKYEQNQEEHKTQHELAGELVDECQQLGLPVDAYVCDAALAEPGLMEKIENYGKAWVSKLAKSRLVQTAKGAFETIESFGKSLPKDVFKPTDVETRHGQPRTYWCFSKCVMVHKWKRLRVVISFDNEKLEGEPIYLITNKTNWTQPKKILNVYMRRDPVEHLIRDGKQELGLEDCQQRNEQGVQKHWELSFAAYTFLELGLDVPDLPGVPAVKLETIGQKSRVMEGVLLQGLVNYIAQMVREGRDTREFIKRVMERRLNRLAT